MLEKTFDYFLDWLNFLQKFQETNIMLWEIGLERMLEKWIQMWRHLNEELRVKFLKVHCSPNVCRINVTTTQYEKSQVRKYY